MISWCFRFKVTNTFLQRRRIRIRQLRKFVLLSRNQDTERFNAVGILEKHQADKSLQVL